MKKVIISEKLSQFSNHWNPRVVELGHTVIGCGIN